MNEQKTLKKLGIKSFNEINSKNYGDFLRLYSQMDPEVAKKALEQFPDFAKTTSDCAKEYGTIVKEALSTNESNVKICLEACSKIVDSLSDRLEDDLSLEEKKAYMDHMTYVLGIMQEFDKSNKDFLLRIVTTAGIVLLAMITGGLVALNSNSGNKSN